jgi:NAD(P)-dependent dehydrogenase (short-subunit alcohol dehydrogenase family)
LNFKKERNTTFNNMSLKGKNILITGASRRIGRMLALTIAQQQATVLVHHGNSPSEAEETATAVRELGGQAQIIQADLRDPEQTGTIMEKALQFGPLYALVNNAAIFEAFNLETTDLETWERHLRINLTAPFVLSQAFAKQAPPPLNGKIINILDWRALRPQADHLPYTISKAGLLALTKSLAIALAPRIQVNGLALGAILPPSDGTFSDTILSHIPAGRWAKPDELGQAFLFLLEAPDYLTGEILHLDGGRHLI